MKIPDPLYPCSVCMIKQFASESVYNSDELRLVGEEFVCKECYYDSLAEQGLEAFESGPDFEKFPTLKEILNIQENRKD